MTGYWILPFEDNWVCPVTKVNPYKACIYGLCRDFLDGNGYDLGTKILIFWRKMLSRRSCLRPFQVLCKR